MPLATHKSSRKFFTQGSIALADILANSVAVILILIIVTARIQEINAQKEIEKNADVTSILARKIATSVVFNDLPSSPPALLHDYNSCRDPHDCNPDLYPILELMNGYVRIYNSNTKIYRNELMREDNALDRYLRSISPEERFRIRIDIHFLSEYYLALGILQENGIRPRHWHFLGEKVPEITNPILSDAQIIGQAESQSLEAGLGFNADGTSEDGNALEDGSLEGQNGEADGQSSSEQISQGFGSLGQDSFLAGAEQLQQLEYESLLPPTELDTQAGNLSNQGESQGQSPSGDSQEGTQPGRKPENVYEALIASMAQAKGLTGQAEEGSSNRQGATGVNFHIPNMQSIEAPPGREEVVLEPEAFLKVMLTFVYTILDIAQEKQSLNLPQEMQAIESYYAQNPDEIDNSPFKDVVESTYQKFTQQASKPKPLLNSAGNPQVLGNSLVVETNTPKPNISFVEPQPSGLFQEILGQQNIAISTILRLYPSLFKGQRLDVPEDFMLLSLPKQEQNPGQAWLPVAFVSLDFSQISLGFVYAQASEESLVLSAGANQIELNEQRIDVPHISDEDTGTYRFSYLWLVLVVVLVVFFIRYPRLGFSRKAHA